MRINRVANFINNSKTAQSVLKKVDKNPAIWGTVTSAILAGVFRPAAIGCLPFKEKKDKQYSQASAVAAATTELIGGCLLFLPLKGILQKASDNLYKSTGTVYHNNPAILRQFKSITNRGIKLIGLIPLSLMRFSMVKPIVNAVFNKEGQHVHK